jgi:hypothetical protein
VERTLSNRRGSLSDRAALGARLETATLLLEGAARAVMAGQTDNDALADVLMSRYGAQDAIGDATRQAVEMLGGMAFIGGGDVGYLAAACQCLAFHPPSRSSLASSLVDYLSGTGPLLLADAPAPKSQPEPEVPELSDDPVMAADQAADWDNAASLFDGAQNLRLTARECDMKYWFANVPQKTLRGNIVGYAPDLVTPDFLREPGPLHDALMQEVAFRALAEERAARAIGYLMACAPDSTTMEFYATQLFDETRHAMIFRNHLQNLGVPEKDVPEVIEQLAGGDRETILNPLEEFGLPIVRDNYDFIGGVVLLTVLVEGFLAPSFELS